MNKTAEALKLAENTLRDIIRVYKFEGGTPVTALAAIREALANQSIVLNDPHPPHRLCECTACLEYWTPLPDCDAFAASGKPIDHIAASGKVIAEPVKQEPVAHYKDAPHTIYLQTGCDDPEDCECAFNEWGDTSWCADQIHDTDIPYIRADYAAPVDAKVIRAEVLEEAEEIAKTIGGSFSVEFLAAIRGLK